MTPNPSIDYSARSAGAATLPAPARGASGGGPADEDLTLKNARRPRPLRTLAVTGGKGGVGKTNVSVAIALYAAQTGLRVALLDADFGLAKIHVLLGLRPQATMHDVLEGRMRLMDTLLIGPSNIRILPGASGLAEMANMDEGQRAILLDELGTLSSAFDLLIIDTGAGIAENVIAFVAAADEAVVVTTPEPTALADAYAMIKVVGARRPDLPFHLLVNNAISPAEADASAQRIAQVAAKFLSRPISYVGSIPLDPAVGQAVRANKAFLAAHPHSPAARAVMRIADRLLWSSGKPLDPSASTPATPAAPHSPSATAPPFAERLGAIFGIKRR